MKRLQAVSWLLGLALLGGVITAQSGGERNTPAQQFEQAVTLMDTRGDYRGAAALFEGVAASSDRTLAARALVFLGTCYERLGLEKARQAYEQVLAQFPDQRAAVAQARARLHVLQRSNGALAPATLQLRRLWNSRPFPGAELGFASLDGRALALVAPDGQIALQDLRSGSIGPRVPVGRPADAPPCEPNQIWPVLAPDASAAAFTCYREGQRSEIWVARLNGRPQERPIFRAAEGDAVEPFEWRLPDRVLARVTRTDRSTQLLIVPVEGGEALPVVSLPFVSAHASLSPDGRWVAYDGPDSGEPPRRDVFVVSAAGGTPRIVAGGPADDLMPTWVADGSGLAFVSDRTSSSGLWLQPMTDGRPVSSPRLLTADLGRIAYPMGLTATGAYVYFRQTGLVDVQVVELDHSGMPRGQPSEAGTRYVGANMFPAWSFDGRRLAYRTELGVSRVHTIGVRDLATGTERIVAPAMAWIEMPRWSPDGTRLLARGRGIREGWGFYLIDADTGRTRPFRIMSFMEEDRLGSAQWDPEGDAVVYLAHGQLIRRDLPTGAESVLATFDEGTGVQVLPDPGFAISRVDGSMAFAWRTETGTSLRIRTPDGRMREVLRSEPGERIASVAWLPDNRGLVFTRMKTGDGLPEAERWPGVWQIDLASGTSRSLGISMPGLRNIAVSPDGRRLAFTSGWPTREPWILENFLPQPPPARARARR